MIALKKFSQSVDIVNIPFWKRPLFLSTPNQLVPSVKWPGPKAKKAIAASLLKPQKERQAVEGIHESWRKTRLGRSYGIGTPCRRLLRTHLNHTRQKQMNSCHFLSCLFHGGILADAAVFRSMWCIIASDPIIFTVIFDFAFKKKHKWKGTRTHVQYACHCFPNIAVSLDCPSLLCKHCVFRTLDFNM